MAANPERGEIDIVISGKTYTLAMKTAALIALQKHFSTPDQLADMEDVLKRLREKSLEHLVAGIWAGLQKYHPEISFTDTCNLLDECDDWEKVRFVFSSLMAFAMPDPADLRELQGTAKRPRRARAMRGTGENGISKVAASA